MKENQGQNTQRLLVILFGAALLNLAIACGGGGGGGGEGGGGGNTPPAATYSVGGTVSGLTAGQQVVLKNGSDTLTLTTNGPFTFATKVATATPYNVLVDSETVPDPGTCTAGSNVGTVSGANVSNVSVICGAAWTLNVQVTNLNSAPSLGSGLVFQNNGGDNTSVAGFAVSTPFSVKVVQGATYSVTVLTQPGSPNQVCSPVTPADASGTMPTANHTVTFGCSTNFFTVSANVSGLAGTGLRLRNNNNATDELTPVTNGTSAFTVPVAAGMPYAVTVFANPLTLSQTCTVTGGGNGNGGGNIAANVTVNVACVTNPFIVSGTVSGLTAGQSVTLRLNGANNQTVTNPGTAFAFPAIGDGTAYSVSIFSKTAGIGCYLTNGSGTMAGAAVSNVAVTCGPCLSGGNKQISVSWAASRSFDVNNATGGGHKIYYDLATGVSKATANVVNVPRTTSTTAGTITGLWSGCTYFVRVGGYSALNPTGGNLSAESSIAIP